jgi:hypothetical protein
MPSMLKVALPALAAASTAYGTQCSQLLAINMLTFINSRLQRVCYHHNPERW